MNSSALCSLAIMMLCLIYSPLQASAARSLGEQKQSLVAEICKTIVSDNCVGVLKEADPKIEEVEKASEILKVILKTGTKKATEAQEFINGLTKTNNSPGMATCAQIYGAVAKAFPMVGKEIKGDRETADYDAATIADEPGRCQRILDDEHIVNPDITAFYNQVATLSALASQTIDRL